MVKTSAGTVTGGNVLIHFLGHQIEIIFFLWVSEVFLFIGVKG